MSVCRFRLKVEQENALTMHFKVVTKLRLGFFHYTNHKHRKVCHQKNRTVCFGFFFFHSGPELRITVLYSLVLGYKWYQKDLNGGRDQGYHQWSPILCHKQGWISKSWTLGRNISTIWVVLGISRIQSWLWWLASFLLFTYQTHPPNQQSPAFW